MSFIELSDRFRRSGQIKCQSFGRRSFLLTAPLVASSIWYESAGPQPLVPQDICDNKDAGLPKVFARPATVFPFEKYSFKFISIQQHLLLIKSINCYYLFLTLLGFLRLYKRHGFTYQIKIKQIVAFAIDKYSSVCYYSTHGNTVTNKQNVSRAIAPRQVIWMECEAVMIQMESSKKCLKLVD